MRRSWAAVTVGAVTLAALAAAFMMFRLTSEKMDEDDGIAVYALFRDAIGIYPKTRVLSSGLEIGQIGNRELDQAAKMAKVTILIDPRKVTLYENAVVQKKAASLLGEFYLDIDPGTATEVKDGKIVQVRKLKDGDRITHVLEPTGVGEIIDQVGATLPILRDILRDVRELTSGEVKQIATNVNRLIETNSVTLERLLVRIDNIAATVESLTTSEADDIRVSIQNVRQITEGLKGLVGTAEGQVSGRGEQLKTSMEKLQSSISSLEKTMKNAESVSARVADGEGTVGRLLTDDTVARNLEDITTDANTFLRGVTRLQTIVGLRTEYNYLAQTFKTYFQIQLQPRPDKFYLIEVIDDPRGFRETTIEQRENSREGTITERKVVTSEKLRISFQFGKRIGALSGRFGIKESTGGAGLDLHMLEDRLTLSTDVFDARGNQYPRLQARGTLAVYKRLLHVIAGVDDVFNYVPTQRGTAAGFFDWFFGAQLTFNDEDLKSLLLVGGSAVSGAAR